MLMSILGNLDSFSYCKVVFCIILKCILYLWKEDKNIALNIGKCVHFGKDRCY